MLILKKKFRALLVLSRIIFSLTKNYPRTSAVIFRHIYEENVENAEPSTWMVEAEATHELLNLIKGKNIKPKLLCSPYWLSDKGYSLSEVFGTVIQFTDSQSVPLPESVFPPERDVKRFVVSVKASTQPVTLRDQLATALDITNNDILGAINLCWVSTRVMARGADQRAYPNIFIDATELRQWNQKICRFNPWKKSEKNDGPGDNYYFWTYVFAIIIFSSKGIMGKIARFVFGRGTKIMTFVRNYIARKQPNMTNHEPASSLGIKVAYMILSLCEDDRDLDEMR